MKLLLVCSLLILLICGGCKETEKAAMEQVNTVEYYTKNVSERLSKLEECNNNPGELAKTSNCINATKAASSGMMGDPNKYRY